MYQPADVQRNEKLPVLVWFHGGRFWHGSTFTHEGKHLAERERLVVVFVQSRLNVFGYLAPPSRLAKRSLTARGKAVNFGLQDQQAALQFVKKNIASFGGDKKRVTVIGESAGGMVGFLHAHMRNSKGLFQRVAAHSPWRYIYPTSKQAIETFWALANRVGCATEGTSDEDALECLRQKPAEEITPEIAKSTPYGPVVDGYMIKDQPLNILQSGDYDRQVDILVGNNQNEGNFIAMLSNGRQGPETPMSDTTYDSVFNTALSTEAYPGMTPEKISEVKSWYEPVKSAAAAQYGAEKANFYAAAAFLGDEQVNCGTYLSTLALATHSKPGKVRAFEFRYQSPEYQPQWANGTHGDDLQWVLGKNVYANTFIPTSDADVEFRNSVMKMWGAFARTGNPNTRNSDVQWRIYQAVTDPVAFVFDRNVPTGQEHIEFRKQVCSDGWSSILQRV